MNAAQTAARLCLPASRSALSGEIVVFVMSLLRWIYSVTPAALIGLSLTDVEERETGEVFLLPLKTLFRVSLLSERLLLLDVFFFCWNTKPPLAFRQTPSSHFTAIKDTLSCFFFVVVVVKLNSGPVSSTCTQFTFYETQKLQGSADD